MSNNGQSKSPATHAKDASPVNGQIPPVEHRWKPGQSGNPSGKPQPAGLTIRSWLNWLADKSEEYLEDVSEDRTEPTSKRIAAKQLLDALGTKRIVAGTSVDRVCDQTAGKPVQAIELSGPDGNPVEQTVKHEFNHDRFADIFASGMRGNIAGKESSPINGN